MFKNKIAMAIKHGNKTLPELTSNNETQFLIPNNTTYSIFIKNLNDKTALINVFIDDKKITKDKIELTPKSHITLFKYEDSMHTFKFIEKDIDLQRHKPSNIEDGLIRVEVEFLNNKITTDLEKLKDGFDKFKDKVGIKQPYKQSPFDVDNTKPFIQDDFNLKPFTQNDFNTTPPFNKNGIIYNSTSSLDTDNCRPFIDSNSKIKNNNLGITVPGKISKKEQPYNKSDNLNNIHSKFDFFIELKIDNELDLNVNKEKKKCPTCKKKYKYKYLYCPYDGTYLVK